MNGAARLTNDASPTPTNLKQSKESKSPNSITKLKLDKLPYNVKLNNQSANVKRRRNGRRTVLTCGILRWTRN